MRTRAPALILTVVLTACGGGDSSAPTTPSTTAGDSCDTLGQVTFVRDTMRDWYLWYEQLPDPDPTGFDSPEAYLQAVRYRPLDTTYSYIASKAAVDAFFSDSQFIGFGVSYRQTSATELRVAEVYAGSPAAEAGLSRGDYLVSIGGVAVSDLLPTGQVGAAFGPDEVGITVAIAWRTAEGQEREATLTKAVVTIPTVPATEIFDNGSARVGYVFLQSFVEPSIGALDAAFDQLLAAGANDLILDERYNGGGLVHVAQHLGSLIGGEPTAGEVFVRYRHNDKHSDANESLLFESEPNALEVPRLVVITTGGSASASELIINSLRPFMTVTVVGDRTFGKPVGQYGFDFCDKTLLAVAFATENAVAEADYFGGIPADCAAADDLDHQLADPGEASLSEALHFLRTGTCSGRASTEAEIQARRREVIPRPYEGDPWRQLIGAY